jgi:hypothetical protein
MGVVRSSCFHNLLSTVAPPLLTPLWAHNSCVLLSNREPLFPQRKPLRLGTAVRSALIQRSRVTRSHHRELSAIALSSFLQFATALESLFLVPLLRGACNMSLCPLHTSPSIY